MHVPNLRTGHKWLFLSILFLMVFTRSVAQAPDSINFSSSFALTNNGISLLPSFSLGKPAGILDIRIGNQFSFEPQLRFSLEGKPWAFVFWWRYQLFEKNNRFNLRVGAHPAILFRTIPNADPSNNEDMIEAHRYIAGELAPSYRVAKHVRIGMYYLKGHGFQNSGTRNSDFITINAYFSRLTISNDYYMTLYPQVYFLKMDKNTGYYATVTIALKRDDFPITIESILNQSIKTEIAGDQFLWNLSLIYSIGGSYAKIKD
ncbi:hypothetical protein [Marinoscillum pacificum]|uniref:hypothetical protein n=1 Tax=Marinoscillum pacificum TaxID=392723 RepID=UPI00215810A9|nr:hypothetical protein [Marinoscillum pacificum]